MTTPANPFARSNGGMPIPRAARRKTDDRLDDFRRSVVAKRSSFIVLGGVRGVGKTVELKRLAEVFQRDSVTTMSVTPGTISPEEMMNQALDKALGMSGRSSRTTLKKWATKAGGGALPLEIALEGEFSRPDLAFGSRLVQLYRDEAVAGSPLVILVDEADLLTPEQFVATFEPVVHHASKEGWPISLVLSSAFNDLSRFRGSLSFVPDLLEPVWIPRVDAEESARLLVATAGEGGVDWGE